MKTQKLWRKRVRQVYDSLAELASYDLIYGVCERCGYYSPDEMWSDNKFLQGSVNPADFGLATKQ